jgi:hypothetical protein
VYSGSVAVELAGYRVLRLLGAGGMAEVYEVASAHGGPSLAMKRLLPEAARRPGVELLFRREYASLAQFAHPLIIKAHDYGIAAGTPYYTMDLLSGDDLRALAPLPWREACALARDVASALALVHSRRLVHRDVSARNVRRTPDGRAKLFDFGALCPMGVAYAATGTPPFVSPENLAGQPLDARSDLFSLGALMYLLLTGEHAYPATTFAELSATWNERLLAPSAQVTGIPRALDGLILSLLSLNPLARPGSAAEVFERLTAIADLKASDVPEIAQAYLVTPTLVGRDDAVLRFRRRLLRVERGRGSTLLLEGGSGSGRSRLLTSLLTEAKLRGMTVLYAQGGLGRNSPFAIVRGLARRLLEAGAPIAAPDPALLAHIGPAAGVTDALPAPAPAPEDWPEAVSALSKWFIEVAATMPLVIGIDDMEDSDEPSLAILSQLIEAAPSRQLLVAATAEPASPRAAIQRFRKYGSSHVLRPLRPAQTTQLLTQVFGDVPCIEVVSEWVHRLAEGSPRTALELAQHLVDRSVARYEEGSWVLPASLEGLNLPESLDQALDAKIASLTPPARMLAQGLALATDHEPLLFDEYQELFDAADSERVFEALNELVASSILVGQGSTYVFAHKSLKHALERTISSEQRRELHRRLALAYARGSSQASVLTAYHQFLAGEEAHAFSTLVAFNANRSDPFIRGTSLIRSQAGASFYDEIFEWALANDVPVADLTVVGRAVLSVAAVVDTSLARHAPVVLTQLQKDIGLVYWDEFESVADPRERIVSCIGRALSVRETRPERERGLEPQTAIKEFAACTAMLAAVFARTYNLQGVAELAPSIDRLRPLSPAVNVVADVIAYTTNGLRGWLTTDFRLAVLKQVAEPLPGMDEAYRRALQMITTYYQGLAEALIGHDAVFERVASLQGHASYAPLAWQVLMIAHLFQGAERQAEACRLKRDMALIGRLDVDRQLDTSASGESAAYVILGDLMALKRMLPLLKQRADKWPGWMPQYLLVEGTYQALRGDLVKGLELTRRALDLTAPDKHGSWMLALNRVLRLLLQLDRANEARELAQRALAECQKYPLLPAFIDLAEMALAIAECRTGEAQTGMQRAERAVERAEQRGTSGILLIELYAGQAQAAQSVDDVAVFEAASKRIGAMCAKVDSVAFATKLSALLRLSLGGGFEPIEAAVGRFRLRAGPAVQDARIRTELELCRGAEERAKRVLATVLRHSGITQGFLYVNQPDGPVLVASRSNEPPPPETEDYLLDWLQTYWGGGDDETTSDNESFGKRFTLVGIASIRGEEPVIAAVVVLDCNGERQKLVEAPVLRALAEALLDAGDAVAV